MGRHICNLEVITAYTSVVAATNIVQEQAYHDLSCLGVIISTSKSLKCI